MEVTIRRYDFDGRFPRFCCGTVYPDPKTYREHFVSPHEDLPPRYVVKVNGDAGGKGVLVTDSLDDALAAVRTTLDG